MECCAGHFSTKVRTSLAHIMRRVGWTDFGKTALHLSERTDYMNDRENLGVAERESYFLSLCQAKF